MRRKQRGDIDFDYVPRFERLACNGSNVETHMFSDCFPLD